MQHQQNTLRKVGPGSWKTAIGLVLCLGALLGAEKDDAKGKLATIDSIQVQRADGVTKVVIAVTGVIDIKSDRIENPGRVFVDFLNSTPMLPGKQEGLARKVMQAIPVGDGVLRQIRVAENQKGVTRVVLDLAADNVEFHTVAQKSPNRLIVELKKKGTVPGEMRNPLRDAPPSAPVSAPVSVLPTVSAVPEGKIPAMKAPEPKVPEMKFVEPAVGASGRRVVTAEMILSRKPRTVAKASSFVMPAPPVLTSGVKLPKADLTQFPYRNSGFQLRDPRVRPPAVTPVAKQAAQAQSPAVAAARMTAGRQSLTRVLGLKVGKVVIDAGHGGHDPGSIGPTGLMEKELVLDVAKRLGALVEERLGSEVIYTRSDDTFIPLEQRPAIANQAKADLFISIHANSSRISTATGVETYYLNFTTSPEALEVAARENASSERSVGDLTDLIKKIALKDKLDESREFASKVQTSMMSGTVKAGNRTKDRGVRKAPLVVLIGAGMPSVLAEIGFLSNPKEEALLKKPEYRQKLAESLFRGLSQYSGTLSHFTVARSAFEEEN